MNVLDSSGWLEIVAEGPNADVFEEVATKVDELIVPVMTIYEVFKRLLLVADRVEALKLVAAMMDGRVVEVDTTLALEGAKLSVELSLPMADALILATARAHGAVLWTQDADFEGVEGVRFIPKAAGC